MASDWTNLDRAIDVATTEYCVPASEAERVSAAWRAAPDGREGWSVDTLVRYLVEAAEVSR